MSRLEQLLEAEITVIAMRDAQPLTVEGTLDLLASRQEDQLAEVLHRELPVSYAQRVKMLESLPNWQDMPSIAHIRQMYHLSFKELRLADPGKAFHFQNLLSTIKKRHTQTNLLVDGFKQYAEGGTLTVSEINDWLDDFFALRVSTNMLLERYLHLSSRLDLSSMSTMNDDLDFDPEYNPYATTLDAHCSVARVARHAAHVAGKMSQIQYGMSPPIVVIDKTTAGLPCVPRYVFYILSELLKNSIRATVEARGSGSKERLPAIEVLVSGNEERCSCRISDRAGGIPVHRLGQVWSYMYSTAEPIDRPSSRLSVESPSDLRRLLRSEASRAEGNEDDELVLRSPLAGLGCGLPLSRLYVRYLGGSVELQTLPNFGTDVFVHLKRLGTA